MKVKDWFEKKKTARAEQKKEREASRLAAAIEESKHPMLSYEERKRERRERIEECIPIRYRYRFGEWDD